MTQPSQWTIMGRFFPNAAEDEYRGWVVLDAPEPEEDGAEVRLVSREAADRLAEGLSGWALPALEEAIDFLKDAGAGSAVWHRQLRGAADSARAALRVYRRGETE